MDAAPDTSDFVEDTNDFVADKVQPQTQQPQGFSYIHAMKTSLMDALQHPSHLLTAPYDTVESMAENTAAPPAGAINMVLDWMRGKGHLSAEDYKKAKQTASYIPTDNPIAMNSLQAIGNAPGIKQVGQVMGAATSGLAGAMGTDPEITGDVVNTALMAAGPVAKFARAGSAIEGVGATDEAVLNGAGFKNFAPADAGVNQKIGNNAWGQSIGEPTATRLTKGVLSRADTRMTKVLDFIRSPDRQYTLNPDSLDKVISDINTEFTPGDDALIKSNPLQQLRSKLDQTTASIPRRGDLGFVTDSGFRVPAGPTTATVTGEDLGQISSRLGAKAKQSLSGATPNYDLSQGLWAAKDHIDDIIDSQLSPAEKAMHATARSQYRALHGQLLARTGNINPATGDVNLAAIGRFLQRTDTSGFTLGENTSPGYNAATFGVQQMGGDTSLMDTAGNASSTVSKVIKAARVAGVPAQWVMQVGPQFALRRLASNNTFRAALANELRQTSSPENGNATAPAP